MCKLKVIRPRGVEGRVPMHARVCRYVWVTERERERERGGGGGESLNLLNHFHFEDDGFRP